MLLILIQSQTIGLVISAYHASLALHPSVLFPPSAQLAVHMLANIAKTLGRARHSDLLFSHAVLRRTYSKPVPREIKTRPVPRLADTHDIDLASLSTPAILGGVMKSRPAGAAAADLMKALREGEERLVDVELGRYDSPESFDRVTMRLGQYLDWLDMLGSPDSIGKNKVDGRQLYLAQWRGADEIQSLSAVIAPHPVLHKLLDKNRIDVYQTSFFIGPNEAVTTLHHDPYMNCFQLAATSNSAGHGKHFLLLPPTISDILKPKPSSLTRQIQRNTSHLNFSLHHTPGGAPQVHVDQMEDADADLISSAALTCVLKEGETLFIPRRWWHRVENVALLPDEQGKTSDGWTAGVAWWFLYS
ncbi:hypothetical protein EIP91_007016 [Steccherinum ochraceum]|uniref:JmjC domain-containing protein n=1 Tax=Steccherinum ochraceum TaxID=92696 RepID=A0A4R0S0X3_9APHY|nr:hypothetical protein EIP91_007016 [Steccherinum ochraceum]